MERWSCPTDLLRPSSACRPARGRRCATAVCPLGLRRTRLCVDVAVDAFPCGFTRRRCRRDSENVALERKRLRNVDDDPALVEQPSPATSGKISARGGSREFGTNPRSPERPKPGTLRTAHAGSPRSAPRHPGSAPRPQPPRDLPRQRLGTEPAARGKVLPALHGMPPAARPCRGRAPPAKPCQGAGRGTALRRSRPVRSKASPQSRPPAARHCHGAGSPRWQTQDRLPVATPCPWNLPTYRNLACLTARHCHGHGRAKQRLDWHRPPDEPAAEPAAHGNALLPRQCRALPRGRPTAATPCLGTGRP